jgi:hypothetical protein
MSNESFKSVFTFAVVDLISQFNSVSS